MKDKEFKIINVQEKGLLVVILSCEITGHYWADLARELAAYNMPDADVYFDFLYRNGLNNRFFKSKLDGLSLAAGSIKRCNVPEEYVNAADAFFASHVGWIDGSVLPPLQKVYYKKKVGKTRLLLSV